MANPPGNIQSPNDTLFSFQKVLFRDGEEASDVIDTKGAVFVGLFIPNGFSSGRVNFGALLAPGGASHVMNNISGNVRFGSVRSGRYYACKKKDFNGVRYLRVLGDTPQDGDVEIYYALRG